MTDQLDMFGSDPTPDTRQIYEQAQRVDEWPAKPSDPEDGALVRAGLEALKAQGPPARVSPVVMDVITKFLAGVVYREETAFEKLSAAKRKTAERAAQAAVNVFANETEETDG